MRNLNLKVVLVAVVITLLGIAVAYAAMSTSLNVTTNNITLTNLSWNVGFQGNSATPSVGGTSDAGRSCGSATITSSTVTVSNTTLSKPDDSCTYELTISNSGTIPAKLGSITPTKPTSTVCETATNGLMVCGNITYTLASDTTGTELSTNTVINPSNTMTVYLIVKYTGTTLNSSSVTQAGGKFSLVFNQA